MEYITLPKGTILHHFQTYKNKNYRWYYLSTQDYHKCVHPSLKLEKYKTICDIQLEKHYFPKLINRKTKEVINKEGIYNSNEYYFKRNRCSCMQIKNQLTGNPPKVTYENFCKTDPLRNINIFDKENNYNQCIEYEFIIDNMYVELLDD